ncbi:MAG: 3-dehydroquinate synthase [Bacteroidetes bacterium]|nr:3-dehydroquinate synthase [Bacteroidota bacterium]
MQITATGYTIYFEEGRFSLLKAFLSEQVFSSIFILCDTNTKKECLPIFLKKIPKLKNTAIITIPAGEKHKNLHSVEMIWGFLTQHQADKQSLLLSLGGGVVSDIGGFAAATYKRGMSVVHIPTTLLAMADASVGGKNGINFKTYKNHIGTITQPLAVFIYKPFLKTLPPRELKNGFAEILKAALIADASLCKKIYAEKKASYTSHIVRAVSIKNAIVQSDLLEHHARKVLNVGHTVGHAIESYFMYKKKYLLHGEAVAIGICVELCLGKNKGITQAKTAMDAVLWIKKQYTLLRFSKKEIECLIELMQQDKKNKGGRYCFSLLKKTGQALIDIPATDSEIRNAFLLYNNIAHG